MNQQAENTEKNARGRSQNPRGRGNSSVTPQSNDLFLEIPFPDRIQADVSHFNAFH